MRGMCIDAQMLSAYLDGELAEPYRTQVKEHLEHCPACRHHLEDMREIGDRIRSTEYPSQMLDRNKDRILSVLDAKYFQNGRKVGFFRRRLEVSLPSLVTAAAAVVSSLLPPQAAMDRSISTARKHAIIFFIFISPLSFCESYLSMLPCYHTKVKKKMKKDPLQSPFPLPLAAAVAGALGVARLLRPMARDGDFLGGASAAVVINAAYGLTGHVQGSFRRLEVIDGLSLVHPVEACAAGILAAGGVGALHPDLTLTAVSVLVVRAALGAASQIGHVPSSFSRCQD